VRRRADVNACYRLDLAYDGTEFGGWAKQPGRRTVEGVLEETLAVALRERVRLSVAGRTDAGVHALAQVASCSIDVRLEDRVVQRALNANLPADIVVRDAAWVPAEFDARRSARGKTYRYTLLRRADRSALEGRFSLHVPYAVDVEAMGDAAQCLVGTHDFSAFRAGTCAAATPVRTVNRAGWRTEGDLCRFEIAGNAFLQHMVRIIVGTLLEVGRGRRRPGDVVEILASRDRRRAGKTAPPHGLCLVRVEY
jgi:tRNA pseudouridine38-40 synthase